MINLLRYLFLIVWSCGLLGVVAFSVVVVILKWMRRSRRDQCYTEEHAKPLSAAIHVICTCICGRVVPRSELNCLISPPKCPLCGSTLRRLQYVHSSWFDKLAAAFRLMLWKWRSAKQKH